MGFFEFILHPLHALVDQLMVWWNVAQNHEFGWTSVERKTGKIVREQQPLLKKLKLLLLFNPITEWIDSTHLMRSYIHDQTIKEGKIEHSQASRKRIQAFVNYYNINMSDFEPSDINAFDSFDSFFIRAHKPGTRPIACKSNPSKAVVVADSRVVTYDTVAETKRLWIKGTEFSITNLVMDVQLGSQFADGAVASFRLSPQDYHRYHSPVTGTIKLLRSIPGDYYQVDPLALRSSVNILTRNARSYLIIDTPEFGEVLFVAIGATNVGTVRIHEQWQMTGTKVTKGDELGIFEFGGSSIIVAFQEGRIRFDEDLVRFSKQAIMVAVEVGMSLGDATRVKA